MKTFKVHIHISIFIGYENGYKIGMIFKRVDQLCMFQRSWNNLMALEHFIVEGLLMLIVNSCGVLLNIIRYWFRTLWKFWQSVWYWTMRMKARKSGYYHGYFFKWNKKSINPFITNEKKSKVCQHRVILPDSRQWSWDYWTTLQ